MTRQTLAEALTLTNDGEGGLTARLTGDFSNAPHSVAQDKGAPFGGLMAALAAGAARRGLGVTAPLRTLTVQYLSGARFEDVSFRPVMTRGGRNVSYASVIGGQGDRHAVQALATFGRDVEGPSLKPWPAPPANPESFQSTALNTDFGPWFTQYIEHRFVDGPRLSGENIGRTPELGCWMRCNDGEALDEGRLLFLLDGLYPTYFTALPGPPAISASVDLRADLLIELTPGTSPEGWAYFHFTSQDVGGGWAVEDGYAQAPDGAPLALVRQRRKILPVR